MAEGSFADRDINILTFVATAGMCCLLVWLVSLLPPRYYFQFSYVIDSGDEHPRDTMMLARPDLPLVQSFCADVAQIRPQDFADRPALLNACQAVIDTPDSEAVFVRADASFGGVRIFPAAFEDDIRTIAARTKEISDRQKTSSDALDRKTAAILSGATVEQLDRDLRQGAENLVGDNATDAESDEQSNDADSASDDENEQDADAASSPVPKGVSTKETMPELFWSFVRAADDIDPTGALKSRVTQSLTSDPALVEAAEDYLRVSDRIANSSNAAVEAAARGYQKQQQQKLQKTAYDLMMQRDQYSFVVAIMLKALPALIAGVLARMIFPLRAGDTAPIATATVAFLFAWPVILLWDQAVDAQWRSMRSLFLVMYLLYVLMYYFAGRLGTQLAGRFLKRLRDGPGSARINWSEIATSLTGTLLSSAGAAAINWGLTQVRS